MDLSLKRRRTWRIIWFPKEFQPTSCASRGARRSEPVVERAYTPEGRASNRRVEVEATATLVQSFQDAPATQPTIDTQN